MTVDRLRGKEETLGNFSVAKPLREEREHLDHELRQVIEFDPSRDAAKTELAETRRSSQRYAAKATSSAFELGPEQGAGAGVAERVEGDPRPRRPATPRRPTRRGSLPSTP